MNSAVIVAGGTSTRFGGKIPKQFIKIDGQEILSFSVDTFLDHPQIDDLVTMDITPKPITAAPPYIQGDEELLPIKSQSLDLALSILNLHSVNDLPGALIQIRNVLKPDGFYLVCTQW